VDNKSVLTKILAIVGTVLVGFPILAPVLFSVAAITQERMFRLTISCRQSFSRSPWPVGACSCGQRCGRVHAVDSSAGVSASR
jgi:hypothetical protein